MTELCRLAEKHGTDKLGFYTPFYDALLRKRRFSVRRVLEIGIGTSETMPHVKDYKAGASLRMWRDYFPLAEIFGMDINPNAVSEAAGKRISTFTCAQRDSERVHEMLGKNTLDLVIDDGSHQLVDQLASIQILLPFLELNGLYIVEDADDAISSYIGFDHTVVRHHHAGFVGKAVLIYGHAE